MADFADIPDLAVRLSQRLTAAGVEHAISGSVAMAVHGWARATMDVDYLVVVPSLRLPELFQIVRDEGFRGEDRALIESVRRNHVAAFEKGDLRVDLFVPFLPWHQTILRRAVVGELRGRKVPLVSQEDILILKLLWLRAKDQGDIDPLFAANAATMDRNYLRRTLCDLVPERHPAHAELARLLAEY